MNGKPLTAFLLTALALWGVFLYKRQRGQLK